MFKLFEMLEKNRMFLSPELLLLIHFLSQMMSESSVYGVMVTATANW